MFYHIMLKTDSLVAYELDKTSLGEIKEDIVTPFLQNQSFQFDGYFIEPSQVRRLVIAETEKESDVYYELERSRQTRIRVYVPKGYLVTG
jgi:hypothetical protein